MDLSGVTVLDLTRLLPGPYATQLLADLGADVIKVEEPATGDYARAMALGEGPDVFSAVNRAKRSVALDLKRDPDREAFHRLAESADVVVEGFRPGVTERLGVDYETLRGHNEALVYVSLSGFGATGPNRDRAGHDLNYVALAGLLSLTRTEPDGRPAIPGFPIADMAGGLFAAVSVLAGLVDRELGSGGGEHVDVSLADAVAALSPAVAPRAFAGENPRARETALTGKFPCYDVYEAADGGYVTLAALEPQFWRTFCAAVDRPDLVDRHLSPDPAVRAALREEVAAVFDQRPAEEWEAALGGEDAMVAPVRSLAEALAGGQLRDRGLVRDGPAGERVGFPAMTSGDLPDVAEETPGLGEHTEAVLREGGVDETTIAAVVEGDSG